MVQQAFGGRAETVYKCHVCGLESVRADNFRDLQLSFPSDFIEGDSVQTLLEYYLKPERLCGDNQYHCERCNGLSDAERVFRVIQPPPRLVLTLKHFHYNSASHQRIKLLHQVEYNPSIKLANATYDLYAAVIHCGTSVDSGHYYTYARDGENWFKFNDSFVSACSASDLSNLRPPETPYILFYMREDCIEPKPVHRAQLSSPVEATLKREIAELEAEERNRQRVITNKRYFPLKRDDPPPPGCGGGGSFVANDRFVC